MKPQVSHLTASVKPQNSTLKLILSLAVATIVALLLVVATMITSGCSNTSSTSQKKAKSNQFAVMSTTDMHGKVWDKNLLTGETVENSFLKVYSAVKETKETFDNRTVTFDNGDLYQGTDMTTYALRQSVFEKYKYISPAAYCLQFCGYDGYTLGNHEFNYNWQIMSNTYQYLDCAGIPCVCANIYDKTTGQRVFKPYLTKTLNIDGNNFTVAVIGLENTDCPRWDSATHYPNMIFHSPENPNADQAYEISKVQQEMKNAGVHYDFLIVSMHSGFMKEGGAYDSSKDYYAQFEKEAQEPLVYLKNTENQTYRTIKNTTDVNMFITGHDHVSYFSNDHVTNNAGQDVLMVSGGGKDLTKSIFSVSKNASTGKFEVKLDTSENVDLSKYQNADELRGVLKASAQDSEKYLNQYITKFEENWDNNTEYKASDYYVKQTDTMDIIMRSEMWAATKYLSEKYPTIDSLNAKLKQQYGANSGVQINDTKVQADVAFSTCGSVVKNPKGGGDIYMKDLLNIFKYSNTTMAEPIKGDQLKAILEYNASDRLSVKTDDQGNKSIEVKGDKYTYVETYGLDFYYDINKPAGQRVTINGFTNGKAFDPNAYYMVATTNYLCDNTGNPTLAPLTSANNLLTDMTDEGLVIDVLRDYCISMNGQNGMVYRTQNAEKNGMQTSKWEIRY